MVGRLERFGDANPVSDPNPERDKEAYAIGEALHALGKDDSEGTLYMQVAYRAIKEIYDWHPFWLNRHWNGIGRWVA